MKVVTICWKLFS